MANIESAKKAHRQSERKRKRNSNIKKKMRDARKLVRDLVEKKDKSGAEKQINVAYSEIDKAAKKGIIKKNTASRYKARLMKSVNSVK